MGCEGRWGCEERWGYEGRCGDMAYVRVNVREDVRMHVCGCTCSFVHN